MTIIKATHGGSRPGTGGARPGAGRKSKPTEEQQQAMRDVVRAAVTEDDWHTVTLTALSRAKAGDAGARDWLTSWVMGATPKQPIEVSGPGGGPIPVENYDHGAAIAAIAAVAGGPAGDP